MSREWERRGRPMVGGLDMHSFNWYLWALGLHGGRSRMIGGEVNAEGVKEKTDNLLHNFVKGYLAFWTSKGYFSCKYLIFSLLLCCRPHWKNLLSASSLSVLDSFACSSTVGQRTTSDPWLPGNFSSLLSQKIFALPFKLPWLGSGDYIKRYFGEKMKVLSCFGVVYTLGWWGG